MFQNLSQLTELLKNAGKLRSSLENAVQALAQLQVEGSAGGGAVTACVNGRLELVRVRIDPKLVADNDVELLEDLITAAVNQAIAKAREEAARSMQNATGGLPIGDLSNLFGSSGA